MEIRKRFGEKRSKTCPPDPLLYTGTPAGVGPVHIDDHLEGWLEERKVLAFNCK